MLLLRCSGAYRPATAAAAAEGRKQFLQNCFVVKVSERTNINLFPRGSK